MKLIVDSGSTKATWALVSETGEIIKRTTTEGINPQFMNCQTTSNTIEGAAKSMPSDSTIKQIWFYGAGCIDEKSNLMLCQRLKSVFETSQIDINSDMLGAARALFGSGNGIACILGTGSNSALYDGDAMKYNTYAGGFILGDEGSGAVLGKHLISDWVKRCMPEHIYNILSGEYNLTYSEVVDKVYRQPYPNRYLASFAKFVGAHIGEEYMQQLVSEEFSLFFRRNISHYPPHLPIGFIGSVAYYFAPQLQDAARQFGRTIIDIQKEPIESLAMYHTHNNSGQ